MTQRSTWRLLGPLTALGALLAVAAFIVGSVSSPGRVEAGITLQRSVSCADIYQDISNDTPLGNAHDDDDILAATSISRLDVPSQTGGDADITSATYLGPDLIPGDDDGGGDDTDAGAGLIPGDSIPDTGPATALCLDATNNANSGAEKNTFHPRMNFASQYGNRPTDTVLFGTYDPTNTEDVGQPAGNTGGPCNDGVDNGDSGVSGYTVTAVSFDQLDTDCYDFPGSGADTLVFSGCGYSESLGAWARTDVFTKVVNTTAKTQNFGKSVLILNTASPVGLGGTTDSNGDTVGDTAVNPNDCTGGLAFPGVIESTTREITTDETGLSKNTSLTADPDTGSSRDSSDGLADDWDGDGCTDWDELDKNFNGSYPVSVTGPVHGLDPFNPADCDENLDSTISIVTTVFRNTTKAFLGTGNGQYFRCISDVTDPKTGDSRAVTLTLGCYSDSTAAVVNSAYQEAGGNDTCPPAPQSMCGDGRAGSPPPSAECQNTAGQCSGAFIGIDTAMYPVAASGTYNKTADTLTIGGCFVGLGGPVFGPNVHGSGSFDTRVGAGTFTIRIGIQDEADCLDGPPFSTGSDINGVATYVELQSKKDNSGGALAATAHKNSDRDGCTDTQELRSNEMQGGYRDPYNDYDYFNPTGDKVNRVDDILSVVNEYFNDDPPGDIDYASTTDRSAIPGGNSWNLGPPNGVQRVDDILAAVKQYFHDCNA